VERRAASRSAEAGPASTGPRDLPLRRLFPHAPFNDREAADRFVAIEAHHRELGSRLGRDVGLSVAALDYLQNVSRDLVAPTIVEHEVLQVLEHRSITDSLTGLFNRHQFEATLKWEVARCQRYGARLALLLLDVDHLKAVNDRWGHQAGDRVLSGVAGAIRDSVRSSDMVSRYGGDEFAIILPDTDARAGSLVAERICAKVRASLGTGILPGISTEGTVSGGLAELPLAPTPTSETELIVAADRALYLAKRRGGNCVAQTASNPTTGEEAGP
jgi:diguanylate cyclase (GGDEF)-like protein